MPSGGTTTLRGARPQAAAVATAAIALAVLLALAGWQWHAAGAQPGQPGQDSTGLDDLRERYDEAVAEEAHLLDAYDRSVGRLTELGERIVELNESIGVAEAELIAAEEGLRQAEDHLFVTEVRLREVTEQLEQARQRLHDQAVAAYIQGGEDASRLRALLAAQDLDELAKSRVYASAVVEDQQRVIEEFRSLRDEAERLRAEASAARDAATGARDLVAQRRIGLIEDRERHGIAHAEAFLETMGQTELISEVQSRKSDYQLRIAILSGTSDSITGILEARQRGQALPENTFGIFARPVPGGISSSYGPRLHPIFGTMRMHNGVDMRAGMGQPIVAAEAGTVVIAGPRGGYGNTVVIDHGNALGTVYAHMSSFAVQVGDVVERGQVLGGVGSTGVSTGPHLHFEVRVLGVPVDPVPYLAS